MEDPRPTSPNEEMEKIKETLFHLEQQQERDRATIQNLQTKFDSAALQYDRQLSELQESIAMNRVICTATLNRYASDFLLRPSGPFNKHLASNDGDALADCILYETQVRSDEDDYEALYGFTPAQVRSLAQCRPLMRAISLRGTIAMDASLDNDDRQQFAGMVQSLWTSYVLLDEDVKESAFDAGEQEGLSATMVGIVNEVQRLQRLSQWSYKRGSGLYPWWV